MGPEAAINAVFLNQIQAIEDEDERAEFVRAKREEYSADIDILHLASEMVVDAVIEPDDLRGELIRRFAFAEGRRPQPSPSAATRSRRRSGQARRHPRKWRRRPDSDPTTGS